MNDGIGDATLALSKTVRRQLAAGIFRGPPRFLNAGPSLDGDPPLGSNPVVVRTAAEARAAVAQLASNGADLIKVYENLSREAYSAIMDEARHRRIPVDGHVPFRITPEEVADGGQRTVEHPDALAAACSTAAEPSENGSQVFLPTTTACQRARSSWQCSGTPASSTTAGIRPPARPPSRRSGETGWRSPPISSHITTS